MTENSRETPDVEISPEKNTYPNNVISIVDKLKTQKEEYNRKLCENIAASIAHLTR
jgi:3-methyladenine DNA glycosylase AlkC